MPDQNNVSERKPFHKSFVERFKFCILQSTSQKSYGMGGIFTLQDLLCGTNVPDDAVAGLCDELSGLKTDNKFIKGSIDSMIENLRSRTT